MLYSQRSVEHGTSGVAAVDISGFSLETKSVLARSVDLEQFDFCVAITRFGLGFVAVWARAGRVSIWRRKKSFVKILTLYASSQDG